MKKTYKRIIIIVLILLFGYVALNFQQLFIVPKYRTPIIENMIDPTSVLFKNEKIHGKFLCGEFNSKNRMGAYTGFNRFISNPDKALLGIDEVESDAKNVSAALEFEVGIREALNSDKKSYGEYQLLTNEYDAKQFVSREEWDKAKSTFKQTKFTIIWNSICK